MEVLAFGPPHPQVSDNWCPPTGARVSVETPIRALFLCIGQAPGQSSTMIASSFGLFSAPAWSGGENNRAGADRPSNRGLQN